MTRGWQWIGALLMTLVLAGCASAPPKGPAAPRALEAPTPAECEARASSGNGVARLGQSLGYIALALLVGALQGASDGAGWALWTGGSMSEAAWIGAAAGASVGFLFGFGASLIKAGSDWKPEPVATQRCPAFLAEPAASMEETT